jgi:hypothetical protein
VKTDKRVATPNTSSAMLEQICVFETKLSWVFKIVLFKVWCWDFVYNNVSQSYSHCQVYNREIVRGQSCICMGLGFMEIHDCVVHRIRPISWVAFVWEWSYCSTLQWAVWGNYMALRRRTQGLCLLWQMELRMSSRSKSNIVGWIMVMEVSKVRMWVSEIVNNIDMLPFLVALSKMFVYTNNFLISILRSKATLLKNLERVT